MTGSNPYRYGMVMSLAASVSAERIAELTDEAHGAFAQGNLPLARQRLSAAKAMAASVSADCSLAITALDMKMEREQ